MFALFTEEKIRINLYAVVLDASAPYYKDKIGKYLCTLKLIDETVCPGLPHKSKKNGNIVATFFAKTAGELPQPTKIGSIIRVHRGQTKKHKDIMQLNCDVTCKGAWILFDPFVGMQPMSHTGKTFTWDRADKTAVNATREWAKKFFDENELSGISLAEAFAKKKQDFDFMGLVLDVKKKGKTEQIMICDSDKVVKLEIAVGRNPYISPNEVVRVRSANIGADKKANKLTLNEYSNILRVPNGYKSSKVLIKAVEASNASGEVKAKLLMYTPHPENNIIGSKILNAHKVTECTPLKELFSGEVRKGAGKFCKVKANVVEINPKDLRDWICVVNTATLKQ